MRRSFVKKDNAPTEGQREMISDLASAYVEATSTARADAALHRALGFIDGVRSLWGDCHAVQILRETWRERARVELSPAESSAVSRDIGSSDADPRGLDETHIGVRSRPNLPARRGRPPGDRELIDAVLATESSSTP